MKNIKYSNVYINDWFTLLASLQYKPSISKRVDLVVDDYYMKQKTVELGEVEYQNIVIKKLLNKNNLKESDIDTLISGDLQNQLFASNYNAIKHDIPFLGIYSACATFVEGLIIGGALIQSKAIKKAIVTTSSNNLASEKQFRFPIEYGAIRKKTNTFTCSGSACVLISNKKSNIKIESANIGKVIEMDYKDTNDMGAAMAPGVAETIYEHLTSTERKPSYYDIILTGDLGIYGTYIVKDYLLKKYKLKINNLEDAGTIFYNIKPDSPIAGASGPACLPLVLLSTIIKKYKKILIVASGSLHSCVSTNLNLPIASIGHALSLEVIK